MKTLILILLITNISYSFNKDSLKESTKEKLEKQNKLIKPKKTKETKYFC